MEKNTLINIPSISSPLPDFIEFEIKHEYSPDNYSKRNYKDLSKNQSPSTCFVCRNAAVGYHYDVPSCNGCKTFFRRTLISGRKFACAKSNDCMDNNGLPIDMTKRVCRACRFAKCVQIGMNPLAIQAEVKTEAGKKLRDEILLGNKNEKALTTNNAMVSIEDKVNRIINELSLLELKTNEISISGLPQGYRDMRNLATILNSRIILNSAEIPDLVYSEPKICRRSGEVKQKAMHYIHGGFLSVIEYLKASALSNELDIDTKLVLLKQVTLKCSNMSSAFFSINHMKSDKLMHPDGNVAGPDRNRHGPLGENHREVLQKTLRAMLRNQVDRVEYILMKAITLWDPVISGISERGQQIISKERMKYVECLFSYCLVQNGNMSGPSRFSALLSLAPVFENQQKEQKDIHFLMKAYHHEKHKGAMEHQNRKVSELFEEIMED